MPRDAGGNYTLAAGNPVVAGTIIRPSWANPTMDDLAIAMTDSLSRSGKGGMLVPFLNVDGAVNLPGIAFTSEPSLGIFRETTNEMRAGVAATDSTRWIAGDFGFEIWSGTAWIKPLVNGAQTITGVQTFSALPIFEAGIRINNNTSIVARNFADDTNVAVGRLSTADLWIFGNSTVDSSWRSLASANIQINAITIANFLGGTSGGLVMENNIPFQGKEVGGVARKMLYMDVLDTITLGQSVSKLDISALDPIRVFVGGSAPMVIHPASVQIGAGTPDQERFLNVLSTQQAMAEFEGTNVGAAVLDLNGNASPTGGVGVRIKQNGIITSFSGWRNDLLKFVIAGNQTTVPWAEFASTGMTFPLDGRIFFNDSLGDPRTAMFLQADNEIRIGGTGMPFVSLRCEPLGIIKMNAGTTVSQEFREDSITCKSKGVGTANSSHLQFQDFNSLNTGKIGNLAGFDDLFIQGQGGQNLRFEVLSASFDLVGTTANAANCVLNGASRSVLLSTSARKYKKDIMPIAKSALDKVLDMTPIRYRSRAKADDPKQEFYGLTAEDVHAVDPRLVHMSDGKPEGVMYDRVAVLLLGVVKDMAKRLKVLENA